ncbi:DUF4179 domain-containing protein [Lysinibacillus sp. NPDC048646]|uniref:DUF4179 domain-containing protein n=1 Tax=Lysinibacillus sp. NPDC048646 TaxID=3390574 RepID=UPI003CFF990A
MKNEFEKELKHIMNEEKEMPVKVRESLDQSYAIIRAKSQKKKGNLIWKRIATVACALIVTCVVLTNEQVMAGIHAFFNFGDKGVNRAVTEGFTQEDNSIATDQNIKITLERHFSDTNKIGMSFQLVFEDPAVLNNISEISMDYRLKNGDGEYIEEFLPDTKPLKGDNSYMSGLDYHTSILDSRTGQVQFDVLMDSHKGIIPALKDAMIEIESINLFYSIGELKKIDGTWHLPVDNTFKDQTNSIIEYVMNDTSSIIHVSSAKANPTSTNVIFSVNDIYQNENTFAHHMKIVDEDGNEYQSNSGFSMEIKNNKTIISTNFPITSYNNSKKLIFIVEGVGEAELLKK